jgi:LPS-assembly lipoprotein
MIARRPLLAQLLPLAFALPMLSGCGWEPLYADPQTGKSFAALRAITVNPIAERIGQMLETGLRQSFNPDEIPTKPLYNLKITLSASLADLGIQSQGLGTRGEAQIYASYQLSEIGTNKMLQTGTVHASDSFDIQANGYSTVVAQNDSETRAVEEVRREIVARLTMFLQNKEPKAS